MDYEKAIRGLGRFTDLLRKTPVEIREKVSDITLSRGKPVQLFLMGKAAFLRENGTLSALPSADCPIVSGREIEEIFRALCGYSAYSHTAELKNGFLSTADGLRVGVLGTAVTEGGALRTVREITGLTVRIPREIPGCAGPLFRTGIRPEEGLLICGAPSSGKTTLLRDIARVLGNAGKRVIVLDERFELRSDGFDLGLCTEVLSGYPKREGLSHAVRCLAPEFLLCDELGDGDLDAIKSAAFSGVALIASVHGADPKDFLRRPLCRALLQTGAFQNVAFLRGRGSPSSVETVCKAGDLLARSVAADRSADVSLRGSGRNAAAKSA